LVGARPLPYPLGDSEYAEYTENNSGTPVNITPDFFPYDEPDAEIDLHVRMSMSQFTAIASAIDIGRDIGYGERSYELWRTWCKSLIGVLTVNCEEVADCIESELASGNTTLINQIFETTVQNGFGNPNRVNPTGTKISDRNAADFNDTPVAPLVTCDYDVLWGGIRHGIVERLDELLADTLQDMAAIPTIIGRNAAWLDIVPVLGDIAEAVVNTLSSVTPTLLSLYEAYSSEATKDELACELFDMVCGDCAFPTHKQIYDHFKNYGMPATPEIGAWVLETMTELVTNPVGVTSKVAYFTLMTWQLGIMYLQATFNGETGTAAILKFARLGEDFANDNWLELCDACGEDYALQIWDYTKENYQSYKTAGFSTSYGTWFPGLGWRSDRAPDTSTRITFAQPIQTTWAIRGILIETDLPRASWTNVVIVFRPNVGSGTTGSVNLNTDTATNPNSRCRQGVAPTAGYMEIAVSIIPVGGAILHVRKLAVLFSRTAAPATAISTSDPTVCWIV